MAVRLAVLLLAILPRCLFPASAAGESDTYAVEHYDATLRLDATSGRLSGTARIRIRSLVDRLDRLALDADELSVSEVRTGRRPLHFVQRSDAGGGVLAIDLNPGLPAGRRCVFEVSYTGTPKHGLHVFPDQAWTAFSTSHWLLSDSRPDHRASIRLRLDVPAGWRRSLMATASSSSGAETGSFPPGINPRQSRVLSSVAGRFQAVVEDHNGIGLRLLSARHTPEQLRRLATPTGPMLDFFAAHAGVPYPGRHYTQVFAHGSPVQEVGSFTLLPEQYADDLLAHPDDLWLMAHELAHQWWGIGVTCRTWSDFWLNEGAATFLADRYPGNRFGAARYEREIERSCGIWEDLLRNGQDRPLHFTAWTTPPQAGGRLPYHKGAWVLHLLREQIGTDAFRLGLAAYTREHWQGSVTSADSQDAMERASGRSLAPFFDTWVYR